MLRTRPKHSHSASIYSSIVLVGSRAWEEYEPRTLEIGTR